VPEVARNLREFARVLARVGVGVPKPRWLVGKRLAEQTGRAEGNLAQHEATAQLAHTVVALEQVDDRLKLGCVGAGDAEYDPFLCAVGLANIEIVEREGLVQNAAELGRYLRSALQELQRDCEIVGDVRGLGLMLGIEIVGDKASKTSSPLHATAISQYCRDHGLLLGHRPTGAVSGNVIRILPPFILSRPETDRALAILEAAIEHAEGTVGAAAVSGTGWMQ
jgi:4-aminobutyrate aminotransferase-like enzyme